MYLKEGKKTSQKNSVANSVQQQKRNGTILKDNRPSAVVQQKTVSLMENSMPIQRKETDVIQLFSTPSVVRFGDLKIGRAQNAGIQNENVELGTGLKFIQHFHCNGWNEAARTFPSFTGTFDVGGIIYHYTIVDGGASAWTAAPGIPPQGAFAMQMRTQNKLHELTKAL